MLTDDVSIIIFDITFFKKKLYSIVFILSTKEYIPHSTIILGLEVTKCQDMSWRLQPKAARGEPNIFQFTLFDFST